MLYIPEGTWGEAVYDGDWYRFNNIREVAMEAKSLAPSTVYTLMDSKSFGYAVYDPSQQQVKIVKAFYSIDENDPNSCWQVVEAEGGKCLYNLGAKKYVRLNQDGSFTLTNIPFFIGMTDGSNGVKFNNKDDGEWGFVVNRQMSGENGIDGLVVTSNDVQHPQNSYTTGPPDA